MSNYPNPFNPSTTIRFSLPVAGRVKVSVFNILGQQIRTLVDAPMEAGFRSVLWDGRNDRGLPVASGVYIVRFQTEKFVKSRKMLLLK